MRNLKLLKLIRDQCLLGDKTIVKGILDSETNNHYLITEDGWLYGYNVESGKVCFPLL